MKKMFPLLFCFLTSQLFSFEKLPNNYLISYGTPQAPLHLIQYFSFTCPHCVTLFRKQFQQIKTDYIDRGKIFWIFHPVPLDLLTIQGMECISKLSEQKKQIFFEAIMEELVIDSATLSAQLMKKGMELLGIPIPNLQEKSYLQESTTFTTAFQFIQQADALEALPSVEINGTFLSAQVPDREFIDEQFNLRGSDED